MVAKPDFLPKAMKNLSSRARLPSLRPMGRSLKAVWRWIWVPKPTRFREQTASTGSIVGHQPLALPLESEPEASRSEVQALLLNHSLKTESKTASNQPGEQIGEQSGTNADDPEDFEPRREQSPANAPEDGDGGDTELVLPAGQREDVPDLPAQERTPRRPRIRTMVETMPEGDSSEGGLVDELTESIAEIFEKRVLGDPQIKGWLAGLEPVDTRQLADELRGSAQGIGVYKGSD